MNALLDVACTSAASCWAVGDYGTDDSTTRGEVINNQALHWEWQDLVTGAYSEPSRVERRTMSTSSAASGAPRRPAAGWPEPTAWPAKKFMLHNEMLRWTGKKWTLVSVPNLACLGNQGILERALLSSLSCTSAKSCLSAGVALKLGSNDKELNVILRWNGTKWLKDQVPNPDGTKPGSFNGLTSVTCASPQDCWAMGTTGGMGTEPGLNQALHWTGTKWKVVKTPNPEGTTKQDSNLLNGVRCTSRTNCWAVGCCSTATDPSRMRPCTGPC